MNIWVNSCKVLVFTVVVGSSVLAMEKPASPTLTPDLIREDSSTPPASQDLRRPKAAKKHSRKKSIDLRGSQDSDDSRDDQYRIPAMPTPADVNSALRYFDFKDLPKDSEEINVAYDERVSHMCNQDYYSQDEPFARKCRDILLLVWYKKQCGVEFYQLLRSDHLEKFKLNQALYDQGLALLALVAD